MTRLLVLLAIVALVAGAVYYVSRVRASREVGQARRIRELEEQVDLLAHEEVERSERRED